MFILLLTIFFINTNNITNIRTHNYKNKSRIVFDIENDFSYYHVFNEKNLTITLNNINKDSINIINKNLKNIKNIKYINPFYLDAEKELIIEIIFNIKYFPELFSLKDPNRLVLDLYFKENKQ